MTALMMLEFKESKGVLGNFLYRKQDVYFRITMFFSPRVVIIQAFLSIEYTTTKKSP